MISLRILQFLYRSRIRYIFAIRTSLQEARLQMKTFLSYVVTIAYLSKGNPPSSYSIPAITYPMFFIIVCKHFISFRAVRPLQSVNASLAGVALRNIILCLYFPYLFSAHPLRDELMNHPPSLSFNFNKQINIVCKSQI